MLRREVELPPTRHKECRPGTIQSHEVAVFRRRVPYLPEALEFGSRFCLRQRWKASLPLRGNYRIGGPVSLQPCARLVAVNSSFYHCKVLSCTVW